MKVISDIKISSCSLLWSIILLLAVGISLHAQPLSSQQEALLRSSSPFERGRWVKIAIQQNGIYAISYEELKKLGFVDPTAVGVFGFGGALMSERLDKRPSDYMPAVPVWHHNGRLLFYGQGPTQIVLNKESHLLTHITNHYATEGYYFLTDAAQKQPIPAYHATHTDNATTTQEYDGYYFHEKELVSLKQSGRMLFGERIANGNKLLVNIETENNISTGKGHLTLAYVALPKQVGQMTVTLNGQNLFTDEVQRKEDLSAPNYLKGIRHVVTKDFSVATNKQATVELSFTPSNEIAYLDFIALQTKNNLSYTPGKQLAFRQATNAQKTLRQTINALPDDAKVWAILSPNKIFEVPLEKGVFVSETLKPDGQPVEFVAFKDEDALSPRIVGPVANTNRIRAHEGNPDLIIISSNALIREAERLADFHRTRRSLNVLCVSQEEVFNEFSSGTPDATAYRLLMKRFYDLRSDHDISHSTLHLLLFGDGAADNRLISDDWKSIKESGKELLLSYQSVNSLNITSYTSDDYFGLVKDGEDDLSVGAKTLCIGIGRFPVTTLYEAKNAVDKTIYYAENSSRGIWKNRATIVADDGNGYAHLRRAEELSKVLLKMMPEMMINKVYFDAFPKENKNGLTTFPLAKRKLFDAFEKGMLIVNYTGHGNPNAWADEQILTSSDIRRFNYPHLPLWITATCDFTNFDSYITSAGEAAFLNPKSGAIGLVTTTRVVYDIYNQELNLALLETFFEKKPDGKTVSFGTATRNAKNKLRSAFDDSSLINKLIFMYVGDPSIDFNLPSHRVVVEQINDTELSGDNDVELKALQKVTVKGSIRDANQHIDGNFSGDLSIIIFDSMTTMETLASNKPQEDTPVATYEDYPGLLYAGNCKVDEGHFTFDFIVPKDVTYNGGKNRINLYGYDAQHNIEAMGVDMSTKISSGDNEKNNDGKGPEIRKFQLDEASEENNFQTGPTPLLYVQLFDESGINLASGGLGHEITLIIDGRADYTFVLNDYYTASTNEAGVGEIIYRLPQIEEGDHEALFTVWDVANNVSEYRCHFRVNNDLAPNSSAAIVYPNPVPFGQAISFQLTFSNAQELLTGYLQLFDFTGREVVRSESFDIRPNTMGATSISVQPQTLYGTSPIPGLYLYRWTFTAPNGKQSFAKGKLVIIEPSNLKETPSTP